MAKHSVAANLMMVVVILAGLMAAFRTKQEVFPEFDLDIITVRVAYPGASPAEIEQGIILAVEEAVRGIDGVKRVTSVASEGSGTVTMELELGEDANVVLADVKSAVDRIRTFPENAERSEAAIGSRKRAVISLVISGDQDLRTLHALGERARSELLESPDVTQVELFGVPPLEIGIEVGKEQLEAYGIGLGDIAREVRAASIELPGGGLDTSGGELLIRVADRRVSARDFEDIVLRGTGQADEVRLGDIARITDGYEDTDQAYYFNGQRAVRLTAYRVGDETPLKVAQVTREFGERFQRDLGGAVTVTPWDDGSVILRDRIDLLMRNAKLGFVLVLVVLALFLHRRLAGWVAAGVPVAFMGAFMLMGPLDASINMVTLFALIITLGIVVDDAIIVSENVHKRRMDGMSPLDAAIYGAREMPVTFSVLTTLAAFAPLMFVPGTLGKIFRLIPLVVIIVLTFSLLESFFILPAHLAHQGKSKRLARFFGSGLMRYVVWTFATPIDWAQRHMSGGLERFTERVFVPLLELVLKYRRATLAFAVTSLLVLVAVVKSGLVPFSFFPTIEGQVVSASARLPYGTPIERTREVQKILENAAQEAIDESGGKRIQTGMFTSLGEIQSGGHGGGISASGSHVVGVEVNLVSAEERDFTGLEFEQRWRRHVPPIPGVESLVIGSSGGPSAGKAIDVQLSHRNTEVLARSSSELADELRRFPSLVNVDNSYSAGKPRLDFRLRPEAKTLGLSSADVAATLRASFFGEEALREQRGRNELKAMVRLPEEERTSEQDILDLVVPTPAGGFVPITTVADFERLRAPTEIKREDGRRTVNVSAELGAGVKSPRAALESLEAEVFPEFKQQFPGLDMKLVGRQRERDESMASLGPMYLVALLVIFALLAIPFRSYVQPLIVMSAIPFGILGAVLGHVVMGYGLSFISVMGMVALSGVVVNDSLVLIDAVNRYRRLGLSPYDALVRGAARRLRPILLTSLTTFFGLMPMIFETSRQAKFLIPMAISLGFGALFVTVIVLIVVPCLYLAVEALRGEEQPEPSEDSDLAFSPGE